jgi:hypothetical protein
LPPFGFFGSRLRPPRPFAIVYLLTLRVAVSAPVLGACRLNAISPGAVVSVPGRLQTCWGAAGACRAKSSADAGARKPVWFLLHGAKQGLGRISQNRVALIRVRADAVVPQSNGMLILGHALYVGAMFVCHELGMNLNEY